MSLLMKSMFVLRCTFSMTLTIHIKTAKVILYLCGECDVYECSVPHSIFICVSDRLVWLSMISKVYRNRLFLSDKLCW